MKTFLIFILLVLVYLVLSPTTVLAESFYYFGGIAWKKPYGGYFTITSPYGWRDGSFHRGTDYGLPCGTPVFAASDGIVSSLSRNGIVLGNDSNPQTASNYIKIRHPQGWETVYQHLNGVNVTVGQKVIIGQLIGFSGNTGFVRGKDSTPIQFQGCHLHFELNRNRHYFNPAELLNGKYEHTYKSGHLLARPTQIFAKKDGRALPTPRLVVNRNLNSTGSKKWNELKHYIHLQPPKITFAHRNIKTNIVTVHGVSIPLKHKLNILINNEFLHGIGNSMWEKHYSVRKVEGVRVVLYKNNWEYLGHTKVHDPKGRWSIKLAVGEKLQPQDRVFAEVQIGSDFRELKLKWWHNYYERQVYFSLWLLFQQKVGRPYWGSGSSNYMEIP